MPELLLPVTHEWTARSQTPEGAAIILIPAHNARGFECVVMLRELHIFRINLRRNHRKSEAVPMQGEWLGKLDLRFHSARSTTMRLGIMRHVFKRGARSCTSICSGIFQSR